jgi:hypothetical protein
MARLIPSFMDDRTPPGERDVFNMLAAGPHDWVAIHSLDLAPWNHGLRTEVDFVVLVPDTGLLCVEVKSSESISFENDRWHPSDIRRSPFKQASDGRHTFYRRLRELAPQFRNVPVVHCCVFPKARFDLPPNLSVHPWELVDGRTFQRFATGDDFCADLRSRMRQSIQADGNLQPLLERLSAAQIETIVGACLPVQKRRLGAREEIRSREQEIDRLLRDQQKPVLQLAALNDRVVVSGAAGTGKTLIAMEVARRAAESGRRTLLVCFNQLVGDWMRDHNKRGSQALPNLLVGRAIRIMAELAGVTVPKDPRPQYWETDLPDQLEERLTDPDFRSDALFDYLVVDEAQDLLARPRLWECLTRFLYGGVASGAFCLFGDFDNQVLGERVAMDQAIGAIRSAARPTTYRLSENCRNYRIVGESAVRLSGFSTDVYSAYMRAGGGLQNYDISFYADDREQQEQLARWLKEFKSQGYRPAEITTLSFRTSDDCAAARLAATGHKLRPAWQHVRDSTAYASVHAFKGLENKVIILTDVVLGEPHFHRHLFYTGMTRATESVRVLCHRDSQPILTGWLTEKS